MRILGTLATVGLLALSVASPATAETPNDGKTCFPASCIGQ